MSLFVRQVASPFDTTPEDALEITYIPQIRKDDAGKHTAGIEK
jgi:hypothetical protein